MTKNESICYGVFHKEASQSKLGEGWEALGFSLYYHIFQMNTVLILNYKCSCLFHNVLQPMIYSVFSTSKCNTPAMLLRGVGSLLRGVGSLLQHTKSGTQSEEKRRLYCWTRQFSPVSKEMGALKGKGTALAERRKNQKRGRMGIRNYRGY